MIRKIKALGLAASSVFAFALALSALLASAAQAATPTHPELPDLSHGGFNDACGVATDSDGDIYVASVSFIATTATKEQG